MAEYFALRFILGLACFGLALRVYHYRLGALGTFAFAMYVEASSLLIPMHPYNPAWWRLVWAPCALVRLYLAAQVTVEVYGFLWPRTNRGERSAILAFAAGVGLVICFAAWYWAPVNGFGWFVAGRQYALLLLAAGMSAAWWYVRVSRPVVICDMTQDHGECWCIWLWCSAIAAATGQGGMVWARLDWASGENAWIWISCGMMVIQGMLVGLWAVNLPDLRLRSARGRIYEAE